MELGLKGKRAAVAAATSGLGYAIAEALVREGATVTICHNVGDRARVAASRLGGGTLWVETDLSDPDAAEEFVLSAQEMMGGVDILVTNAPGPPAGTFADTPVEAYQKALNLNLMSVVRMCASAVPAMQAQGWGRVVAVTSIAVRQPIPNLILSNTARAGATGFLKTLAREVAKDGVTVNSVQPGLHDTDRVQAIYGDGLADEIQTIPSRRLGRPEDFGATVAFLCSVQAGYITGVGLPVDGGVYQALL